MTPAFFRVLDSVLSLAKEYHFKCSCLYFQFPKDLFKLHVTEEIGYEENGLPEKVGTNV